MYMYMYEIETGQTRRQSTKMVKDKDDPPNPFKDRLGKDWWIPFSPGISLHGEALLLLSRIELQLAKGGVCTI